MSVQSTVREIERTDVALSVKAAELRHHPMTRATAKVSELADQPPMFTLGALVLASGVLGGRPKLAEAGARLLASVGVATAVKAAIKATVVRTRPNVLLEEGRYETGVWGPNEGPWNSFPSGHTANAVAAARAVARAYPKLHGAGHAVAAAMGLIQVPRGAHHPLDVAAGALVGYGAEAAVDRLWPRARPVLAAVVKAAPVRPAAEAARPPRAPAARGPRPPRPHGRTTLPASAAPKRP